ncbi:MAG: dTMP kinase [Alphaproteobacteria bacterium]|nr:dTMP kinase [Alphaproteobacteria bacterium]
MKPGKLITLEGGEGAGKSTQIARLAAALQASGLAVVTTREPGGSPAGERIRKLLVEGEPGGMAPMTEALLHFAQRAEHIKKTIGPALARGAWVVCDRFADSTMAYQGFGHGLGRAPIQNLCRLVCGDLVPALTLIFDVPVEIGLARAASRRGAETRYERMDEGFHERLRRGFLDIAKREPKRCAVIDATQGVDAVTAEMLKTVSRRLRVKFSN